MKYSYLFLITLLLSLTSFICNKNNDSDKLGQTLTLKLNESVDIQKDQLTVTFKEVVEDSRCPTGVECVWEGQASIKLDINNAESVAIILRAGKDDLAKDTLNGFIYTLLEVSPYPDATVTLPIPLKDYTIDIQVDKL